MSIAETGIDEAAATLSPPEKDHRKQGPTQETFWDIRIFAVA